MTIFYFQKNLHPKATLNYWAKNILFLSKPPYFLLYEPEHQLSEWSNLKGQFRGSRSIWKESLSSFVVISYLVPLACTLGYHSTPTRLAICPVLSILSQRPLPYCFPSRGFYYLESTLPPLLQKCVKKGVQCALGISQSTNVLRCWIYQSIRVNIRKSAFIILPKVKEKTYNILTYRECLIWNIVKHKHCLYWGV